MIRSRKFITLLGGAAAWPVVGFLNPGSPRPYSDRLRAFHQGLSEAGFVEGRNAIDRRSH